MTAAGWMTTPAAATAATADLNGCLLFMNLLLSAQGQTDRAGPSYGGVGREQEGDQERGRHAQPAQGHDAILGLLRRLRMAGALQPPTEQGQIFQLHVMSRW